MESRIDIMYCTNYKCRKKDFCVRYVCLQEFGSGCAYSSFREDTARAMCHVFIHIEELIGLDRSSMPIFERTKRLLN